MISGAGFLGFAPRCHDRAFGTFSVPRAEGLRQLLIAGPEAGMQTSRIMIDLVNRKHGDRVLV